MSLESAYAGAPVFVTGADGFIGSHLVERLISLGARVRALVYYNSWQSVGWLAALPPEILAGVDILPGDVRDAERIAQGVAGCRYVFHLASLIGIPYSYDAPRSYLQTNVGGALNLLEAVRRAGTVEALLHVSTSEVYGTARRVPIAEDHPLVGQSPYAAMKIAADKLAESYHLSFGVPVVTARPFNTYGPRQTARAVIPAVASQLLAGCAELRLGALHPTRDFTFAPDTAEGMLRLAATPEARGKVVNIGTGEEWGIGQVAGMLMEICGRKVPIVADDARLRPAASEVERLVCDNALLRRLTGWVPATGLPQGLERTVAWLRDHLHLFSPGRYQV